MNRIKIYNEIVSSMKQLFGGRKLETEERGNIAMAVNALEDDLKAEQLTRAIAHCTDEGNLSDACYRILRLAYQDWEKRLAPSQDAAYCAIIKQKWLSCQGKGNNKVLDSVVLFVHYKEYPDFFKPLDMMDFLLKGEG